MFERFDGSCAERAAGIAVTVVMEPVVFEIEAYVGRQFELAQCDGRLVICGHAERRHFEPRIEQQFVRCEYRLGHAVGNVADDEPARYPSA